MLHESRTVLLNTHIKKYPVQINIAETSSLFHKRLLAGEYDSCTEEFRSIWDNCNIPPPERYNIMRIVVEQLIEHKPVEGCSPQVKAAYSSLCHLLANALARPIYNECGIDYAYLPETSYPSGISKQVLSTEGKLNNPYINNAEYDAPDYAPLEVIYAYQRNWSSKSSGFEMRELQLNDYCSIILSGIQAGNDAKGELNYALAKLFGVGGLEEYIKRRPGRLYYKNLDQNFASHNAKTIDNSLKIAASSGHKGALYYSKDSEGNSLLDNNDPAYSYYESKGVISNVDRKYDVSRIVTAYSNLYNVSQNNKVSKCRKVKSLALCISGLADPSILEREGSLERKKNILVLLYKGLKAFVESGCKDYLGKLRFAWIFHYKDEGSKSATTEGISTAGKFDALRESAASGNGDASALLRYSSTDGFEKFSSHMKCSLTPPRVPIFQATEGVPTLTLDNPDFSLPDLMHSIQDVRGNDMASIACFSTIWAMFCQQYIEVKVQNNPDVSKEKPSDAFMMEAYQAISSIIFNKHPGLAGKVDVLFKSYEWKRWLSVLVNLEKNYEFPTGDQRLSDFFKENYKLPREKLIYATGSYLMEKSLESQTLIHQKATREIRALLEKWKFLNEDNRINKNEGGFFPYPLKMNGDLLGDVEEFANRFDYNSQHVKDYTFQQFLNLVAHENGLVPVIISPVHFPCPLK